MDLLHCLTGLLHRQKSFLIDIRGFDGVDLLFYGRDLRRGLFEGVFVLLLPSEGRFGRCWISIPSASNTLHIPASSVQLWAGSSCITPMVEGRRKHTRLIHRDVLPGQRILFRHLVF